MAIEPIWAGTSPGRTASPPLAGDVESTVAIVGGGITGLMAALLLQREGVSVTLLEAHRLGMGTTGRSTGNLYAMCGAGMSQLRRSWSRESVGHVVQSRQAAMALIRDTVGSLSIDCDLRDAAFHYYADADLPAHRAFLDAESTAFSEAGLDPVATKDLGLPFPVALGLRVAGQAQIHPLRYAHGLAAALGTRCRLYEDTPALAIDDATGTILTPNGTVKAEHILMATHVPKGVFAMQALLSPVREYGVAALQGPTTLGPGIYWRVDEPARSVRSLGPYAMAIGEPFKTGNKEDGDRALETLEDYLAVRFGASMPRYRWAAQAYRSADGLPLIGRHGKRTYVMTGFDRDGLVYGALAAMMARDAVLGRENPWAELYDPSRLSFAAVVPVLAEAAHNLLSYGRRFLGGAEAVALTDVRPGDGRVIELADQKWAVHRDRDGKLHVVSAVCTHMKCLVSWNRCESTWDCPCHGSRFATDGSVLEGPALSPLPRGQL